MKEYLKLGHIRKITEEEPDTESNKADQSKAFYIPHHAVLKESSSNTNVHVVFGCFGAKG